MSSCKQRKIEFLCPELVYFYQIDHGDHKDTLDQYTYLSNYDNSWSVVEIVKFKADNYVTK